jgi:hypothetical protein
LVSDGENFEAFGDEDVIFTLFLPPILSPAIGLLSPFVKPLPESHCGLRVIRIIYSQRRWGRPNKRIQLHDRVASRVGLLGIHDVVSLDLVSEQ